MTDAASIYSGVSTHTDPQVQDERRRRIREIMRDPNLSSVEKSKWIQSLMDGRRRSSVTRSSIESSDDTPTDSNSARPPAAAYVNSMYAAAAAAADYYSSDEEGDVPMSSSNNNYYYYDGPGDITYGYNSSSNNDRYNDASSIASEITHSSRYNHSGDATAPPTAGATTTKQLSYRQIHGRSLSLQDWKDHDRIAAAASMSGNALFPDNPAQVSRLMEQCRPPCPHYERNCTIVSPCCGLAFGCRICHDECPVLPPPLAMRKPGAYEYETTRGIGASGKPIERRRSMPVGLMIGQNDEENHHPIDRFAIKEVICRECYTRQSSRTNRCISCNTEFGEYHCNICNLWMSANDKPYHCLDCAFCRVGGRENFRHCHDCGMCIDDGLFNSHNCKSGKYMSNCPICQEDLFSSRHASHEMPCGHAIHWHCFRELTSYDTRCPVCKKTAETPEQMASTWSAIAMGIALQPVPPEFARVVNITCNDCEEPDENRRWHFLGVRCNNCMSFNTNVANIVLHGRDAVAFLDQLEAQQANAGGVPFNIVTTSGSQVIDIPVDDDDDHMEAEEDGSNARVTAHFPGL